jgi:hypothetical protein
MSITPSTLTRAAAIAAMVAGLIYIVIQPLHPTDDLASVTGGTWSVVHVLSLIMAVLGLAGVTGIYLRQVREFGVLGLVGYLLFSGFFILQAAFTFAEAFIAPLSAAGSPELTEDLVGLFAGHEAHTDLGPLALAPLVGVVFYVAGGLVFGVAVLRARILSRWAAILLIAASAGTLLASVLPHEVERLLAIPVGAALVWLGSSLWLDQRRKAPQLLLSKDSAVSAQSASA